MLIEISISFSLPVSLIPTDLNTQKQLKKENSENCGPPPGDNFDLEVGPRSRSGHGVNWKG